MKRVIVLMLLGAFAASANAAETLYVQSLKGTLLAKPAFNADAVAQLKRGDKLTLVKKQGSWYRVKFARTQGWMPKLLLNKRPPMAKVSVFSGKENLLRHKARVRASNVTTAGAARGLSADDRRRVANKQMADYSAVDRMDKMKISEAEALRFIEKGVGR